MSLAWNTRNLLETASGTGAVDTLAVEYHFLSWRELYDKSILTVDRYSSGAAEWVIQGGRRFYTVTVVSRPYYSLPQELCLSFECSVQTTSEESCSGEMRISQPPIERVAIEFLALLSVFAREPLLPLGLRRAGDRPIVDRPHHSYPPRLDRASTPPPLGINSHEFLTILKGFARAPDALAQAVLAAAKFYHAGLSLVTLAPSVAYVSLVSAVECLAGHHYRSLDFEFDSVEKFNRVKDVLRQVEKLPEGPTLVVELKRELLRAEGFLRKKFVLFFEEFVTDELWDIPDELYDYSSVFPEITRDTFGPCVRRVYDARSEYLHGGAPFPSYVEFGLRKRTPTKMLQELMKLQRKQRYLPPFAWFERLIHVVIVEYMRQSFAPALVQAREKRQVEKQRLLEILASLPQNAQDSLAKLAHWTARFLGAAMINPHAPNKDWADSAETVRVLKEAGLIDGQGEGLEGSAWLKDREIGEIVGEFIFGAGANPFRDNELLLPRN